MYIYIMVGIKKEFNYKPILTFGFVLSVTTGCLTVKVLPSPIFPQ